MKKISLIFLLLVGAAGTSFYYAIQQFSAPPNKSSYYAEYLPTDTLAVISIFDLKGLSRSFPQSALGQFFAKPAIGRILAEQGADQEDIWQYESFYDGAADLLTNPFLQQLFGDDVTFALLKPNPINLRYNPEKEVQKQLIAFGSSATGKVIDSIARLTMKDFSKEVINGLQVTRIRLNDDEFLYGHIQDGVIILAYHPELIAQALEQKEHDRSLEKQPWFLAAKKFWTEATTDNCYVNFYCNLKKLRGLLASLKQEKVEGIADFMQGFKSLSSFAAVHQGNFQIHSTVKYDSNALHKSVQQQFQTRTQHNLSLPLLSEKTLFYCWFAGLDQNLLAHLPSALYRSTDQTVQQHLGLNLQQITEAVGPQIGLMINGVANAGFFPLPKLSLFNQIRERGAAQHLVKRIRQSLTDKNFADERVLDLRNYSIYYWSLLPAEVAHPAVALSKQMLYIANGELSLKTLLNQEQQRELSSTTRMLLGSDLATQIEEAGYAVFFARPALLAAEAKKAEVWLNAALGNSTEKFRTELLNVMSSFNLAAWYINFSKNQINSTLFLQPKTATQE